MSTWLSNQTIGLDPDGYRKLLGQASFTSSRVDPSLCKTLIAADTFTVIGALCCSGRLQSKNAG